MNTSQNGTASDSSGSWRPAIAPIWNGSMPVTCPATMIGMPIAPNATGAVFAIRHSPAACSGLKPSPTSSAAVIATGAPKPAAPSRNAPNEKPISSICRRWSSVIDSTDARMMSNWPVFTTTLYRNTAATMIHAIGQMPYAKPKPAAASACGTGIPYARIATPSDSSSVIVAATWPLSRCAASATKKKMIGIAATNADSPRLPSGV